jgi:hypothetical protein
MGLQAIVARRRGEAESGEVHGHDPAVSGQAARDRQPVGGRSSEPVEQEDGPALTSELDLM